MTFYEKVADLCRDRGISITALALDLGFSKGTPTNWKKMTKPPRAQNIKKLSEFFGVPITYFTEDAEEQKEKPTTDGEFSPFAQKAVELFNDVPEEKKAVVLAMLRAALNLPE